MRRFLAPLTVLVALAAGLSPLAAQENQSVYTDLDLGQCLVLEADDFQAVWACPGYRGYPVRVVEADLRFTVSYGFGAEDEKASNQTLPPFNTLGPRIEWRLSNVSGRWLPAATILRWRADDPDSEDGSGREFLVVTQIEAGNTCHLAHIDTSLNEDANALARTWADRLAGTVDCATTEPQTIGMFETY